MLIFIDDLFEIKQTNKQTNKGATRGIGKGIALQLGQNGAKVYITGRTLKANQSRQSLEDTQNEVKNVSLAYLAMSSLFFT